MFDLDSTECRPLRAYSSPHIRHHINSWATHWVNLVQKSDGKPIRHNKSLQDYFLSLLRYRDKQDSPEPDMLYEDYVDSPLCYCQDDPETLQIHEDLVAFENDDSDPSEIIDREESLLTGQPEETSWWQNISDTLYNQQDIYTRLLEFYLTLMALISYGPVTLESNDPELNDVTDGLDVFEKQRQRILLPYRLYQVNLYSLYSISISSTLLRKLFLLVTPIRTPSFETSLTNQFEGRSYSSFLKLPSLTRQTIYRLQYIITYESNNKNLGDIAGREETCLTEQPKDEGCFRFMDLPPPVRRIIYRLLLVNPILGQHESVNRYSDAGTRSQYDLEPAVLRLNRTIYEEASRVLYNENVFYFACVKHCHYTSRWIWRVGEWSWRNTPNWSEEDIRVEGTCALLRYQYERATPLWELPQMKIVKRWRVFVVSEHQNSSLPEFSTRIDWQNASHSLRQFVRTIRRHTLRELTILVLNKRPAAGHPEMKDLLAPLELLTPSNVENPCVRDALPGEFSEFYENTPVEELVIDKTDQSIWQGWSEDFQKSEPLHVESSSEPAIAQEIPAIDYSFAFLKRDLESMTKHTKVEYVFEMWLRLLKYAQAFESRHPFGEISLPVGFEYMGEYKDINSTVYSDDHKRDVIRNKWYKLMEDLPLEHTMVQANRASHEDDMEAFKTQRRIAVEILEPQYQRMVTAWRLFLGFIMQYLSNAHTFFSEDNGLENAIKYLEECVEAFRRDIPVELGVVMRKRARSRMLPDNMYVRDSKMKGLRHAYQKQKIGRLQDMFKSLVDELEEEFHRVRDARKALFDFDILNEPGLDLSQDEEGIYRRIDFEASGWNTVFKVLSHEEKSPVDKGLSATHIYKHYNDIFAI